jgi:uncharacterized protein (TIGR03000 family)
MMRFHPCSAAVVLGSALAVAAATPLAAVAQKNGHSSSSGKSSQGHQPAAGRHQNTSSGSGSGKSAHATTSTGHSKTGAGSKAHSGHPTAEHHAKHKLDHVRQEIHRLERELRNEHLKHLHAAHTRELERLRHEVHRLERELRTDHLKHDHDRPAQQHTPSQGTPAPQSNGTAAAAPHQQWHTHHGNYGRVEVSLPYANAAVLINGAKTTASGTHRVFKTPDLTHGKRYTYRVVALWHHDGKEIREERTVHLTAGSTAQVHFHRPHHAQGQTAPGATGSTSGTTSDD